MLCVAVLLVGGWLLLYWTAGHLSFYSACQMKITAVVLCIEARSNTIAPSLKYPHTYISYINIIIIIIIVMRVKE